MDRIAFNPKGDAVIFLGAAHKYSHDGYNLDSVTSTINSFFPDFDRDKISKFVAARSMQTPQEILAKWELAKTTACDFGTLVHKYAEYRLTNRKPPTPTNDAEYIAFNAVRDFLESLLKEYEVVDVEKIVFSPKLKIAGTIDLIVRNKSSGALMILDWKTNKSIDKKSKSSEKAFAPIDYMPNCNYSKYLLQLNLYRKILQDEKYYDAEVEGLIIVHIVDGKSVLHIMPIMEETVNLMLDARNTRS